eukprot:gene1457-biopygen9199
MSSSHMQKNCYRLRAAWIPNVRHSPVQIGLSPISRYLSCDLGSLHSGVVALTDGDVFIGGAVEPCWDTAGVVTTSLEFAETRGVMRPGGIRCSDNITVLPGR